MIAADNLSDLKKGVVSIYFKETVSIKVVHRNNLHEFLVCEFFWNGRWSYIISLYQSRSQSSDEYDHLIKTFDLIRKQLLVHLNSFKSYLLLIADNLNARSACWWSGIVNNIEGIRLESITTFHELHQGINEATHILHQ